jgi:hypothetical protein
MIGDGILTLSGVVAAFGCDTGDVRISGDLGQQVAPGFREPMVFAC